MEIERITGKLLITHDCVIIPGFGGFIANPAGAAIHPGRHTFSPPFKAILFNRSLTANDGLLANAIAYEKGITYTDAIAVIDSYVRTALTALKNREKLQLPDLGYLQADFEGNIIFTQDINSNLLTDAFGLGEFQSLPIERRTQPVRVTPKTDRVLHPAKAKKRRPVGAILAAAGVTLLVSAVSAFFGLGLEQKVDTATLMFWDNNPGKPVKAIEIPAPEPQTEIRKAIVVDTLTADSIAAPGVTAQIKETAITAPTVTTTVTLETDNNVHIVAGCFEALENAEKFRDMLKADNIQSYILDRKKTKMYKVCVAGFTKLSDAKQHTLTLPAQLQNNVWIYTDKK